MASAATDEKIPSLAVLITGTVAGFVLALHAPMLVLPFVYADASNGHSASDFFASLIQSFPHGYLYVGAIVLGRTQFLDVPAIMVVCICLAIDVSRQAKVKLIALSLFVFATAMTLLAMTAPEFG